MIVVGIDPGATFGWAVVELPGDRALAGGQGSRKKRGDAMDRIARYAATIAAVEDQFVIDDRRVGVKERRGKQAAAIKLAHDAGEWAMWLDALKIGNCDTDNPQAGREDAQMT